MILMVEKKVKIIPTKKKIWETTKAGFRMGIAGGVPTLIAMQILGAPLGRVVGGIVGGAVLSDTIESKVVVGNAIQDGIIMMGL